MSPFHMKLHVAFLGEAHCTVIAFVRPFPCMFFHMNLQCTLLVKSFLTQGTLKGPLTFGKEAKKQEQMN